MELPSWLAGKSPQEVLSLLREDVDNSHNRLADEEKLTFFYGLVDEPEGDPAGEWDAYCRHASLVDQRVSRLRSTALARFDRDVVPLPPADAAAAAYGDDAFWFPGFAAESRRSVEDDPWSGLTSEKKLQHAIHGTRPPRRIDLADERRRVARAAAELRD